MRPLGHTHVIEALERSLPPVTLLWGPRSIGKTTIAEYLVKHHQVHLVDLMRCPAPLRIDAARNAITFVATASAGPYKLILIDLDNASDGARNVLLKTLEEPPPTARFILTASQTVPATIMSRAVVYPMGLLSRRDLTDILVAHGMSESAAAAAAALGHGQVSTAMTANSTDAAKATVLTLVRALAKRDFELFDQTARSFDEPSKQLLLRFFMEALTGRWALFAESDSYDLTVDPTHLRRMLLALNQTPKARPRLQVRVALRPFFLHT